MVSQDFIDKEHGKLRQPAELFYMTNGVVDHYLTSGDVAVDYGGNTYIPALISKGPIKYTSDLSPSKLSVKIEFDNSLIDDYISQIVVDTVWMEIYKIHRDMSPLEIYTIFVGKVESVSFSGNLADLSMVSLKDYLNNVVPKFRYQSGCNHALYSPECGIVDTDNDYSGVVSDITIDGLIVESTAIETLMIADGKSTNNYCQFGICEYGNYKRMITKQDGALFSLRYKIPGLSIGEIITVFAGCDNRILTCFEKFNNVSQFLGFPYIPWDNPVTTVA